MRNDSERSVVITGGGDGPGRVVALAFARARWQLLIADADPAAAQATADHIVAGGGRALACACDVRQDSAVAALAEQAMQRWNGCAAWVNGARLECEGRLTERPVDAWQRSLDVNLLGCLRGVQAALGLMRPLGRGRILNIAAAAGIDGPAETSAYNACMAAVIVLSESLRAELADAGIGLSVLCPGALRSEADEAALSASVLAALRSHRFLLAPQASTRRHWRLKRLVPALYEHGPRPPAAR